MIEIQNLSKHYGQIKAVDNVSFRVEKGEILGFLGPNGAGKTTTMNMITGYLPPTDGTVNVCGFNVATQPMEVKRRIGYLPEHPPIYTDMTVMDYLNFVGDLKKIDKKQKAAQIKDIIELVGIVEVRKRLINNLSKGYRQRVGLAQALIGNPEVLILDEPTVGLDPRQIIEIRKLIRALGKEHTIILSTHILPEVSAICERVVIINKGKIVAEDTPENLARTHENASRILVAVSGPKSSVLPKIKEIFGVKYAEENRKRDSEVVEYIVEADKDVDVRRPIFFAMAKLGYPIIEMKSMDVTLEEIFIDLVTEEKEVG